MQAALPLQAEKFAEVLRLLGLLLFRVGPAFLTNQLLGALTNELQTLRQAFDRFAKQLAEGTFKPRKTPERKPPAEAKAKPERAKPLSPRKRGWLLALLKHQIASLAEETRSLLEQPETQAMLEMAPPSLRRRTRRICWKLGVALPPVLAPVRAPRPPRVRKPRMTKATRWDYPFWKWRPSWQTTQALREMTDRWRAEAGLPPWPDIFAKFDHKRI